MNTPDPHAHCDSRSFAYTTVRCDRCGRTFTCTPFDDFYCADDGDHCCEACLIAPTGATMMAFIDPNAPLPDFVFTDVPKVGHDKGKRHDR
jgi:hypothetical protein